MPDRWPIGLCDTLIAALANAKEANLKWALSLEKTVFLYAALIEKLGIIIPTPTTK